MTTHTGQAETARSIRENLTEFLQGRTRTDVAPDVDLFATGLVTSLFAMELLVHVERTFVVRVAGPDLTLDNFRTVNRMTELVLRLRGGTDA
ncbi:acyl carrier protein [Streptomyces lushanensis]|uniref:acyl carrier protein n=1 Tax=Streptomyces lushanensis TaxID=1434255 RepID=UPI0008295DCF|nr:phosphopantetheine-binding protein [Streptomyces lushanensis]